MKSKKALSIGLIIFEGIWVVDAAVDLYTGEMTHTEFLLLILFCLLGALTIHRLVINKKRKSRDNYGKTGDGSADNSVNSEES